MNTPIFHLRLTLEDKLRIARIKHITGYMTDARAIREALKCHLEQLQQGKKEG